MRTRIVVHIDATSVGKEAEVRKALEEAGVALEPSRGGSGVLVGHADSDSLRRVGEVHGVRRMEADPVFAGTGGHTASGSG